MLLFFTTGQRPLMPVNHELLLDKPKRRCSPSLAGASRMWSIQSFSFCFCWCIRITTVVDYKSVDRYRRNPLRERIKNFICPSRRYNLYKNKPERSKWESHLSFSGTSRDRVPITWAIHDDSVECFHLKSLQSDSTELQLEWKYNLTI